MCVCVFVCRCVVLLLSCCDVVLLCWCVVCVVCVVCAVCVVCVLCFVLCSLLFCALFWFMLFFFVAGVVCDVFVAADSQTLSPLEISIYKGGELIPPVTRCHMKIVGSRTTF